MRKNEIAVAIVPAASEDRDAVVELLAEQLAEHQIDTARAAITHAVDGMLGDERRGFVLLAKEVDAAIGVAWVSFTWTVEHGGKTSWLEELYILPDRRESGLGTRLLHAVLERARASGCAAVDLEVESEHRRAANLYARHGFQAMSRARWVRKL